MHSNSGKLPLGLRYQIHIRKICVDMGKLICMVISRRIGTILNQTPKLKYLIFKHGVGQTTGWMQGKCNLPQGTVFHT